MNIVSRDIKFCIFKKSVDICNMSICLYDNDFQVISAYRNNYLLSREAFSDHIDFRFFSLYFFIVCDIMNFNDLVI